MKEKGGRGITGSSRATILREAIISTAVFSFAF
jgi:hypothetical protein